MRERKVIGYASIHNPSMTATMIATLKVPGSKPKTHRIAPNECLPVYGSAVHWHLWEVSWHEPRKGMMRFSR